MKLFTTLSAIWINSFINKQSLHTRNSAKDTQDDRRKMLSQFTIIKSYLEKGRCERRKEKEKLRFFRDRHMCRCFRCVATCWSQPGKKKFEGNESQFLWYHMPMTSRLYAYGFIALSRSFFSFPLHSLSFLCHFG
jgi:succinate dehydrogenase/fumarate reductase-like Fe-S protein